MNLGMARLARLSIAVICAFALYKLSGVISQHIQGNACPMLGPVPACYLVFLGYAAMLLAVAFNPLRTLWLFFAGWGPVFFLALSGTVLELFSKPTCPRTDSDTPMCFLSLGVASFLIVIFFTARLMLANSHNLAHQKIPD